MEIISGKNCADPPTCCRALENQLYSSSRKQLVPRFSTDDLEPETVEYQSESPVSQTVLTPAAKKQQGRHGRQSHRAQTHRDLQVESSVTVMSGLRCEVRSEDEV